MACRNPLSEIKVATEVLVKTFDRLLNASLDEWQLLAGRLMSNSIAAHKGGDRDTCDSY